VLPLLSIFSNGHGSNRVVILMELLGESIHVRLVSDNETSDANQSRIETVK
jgi:hypothetical protein